MKKRSNIREIFGIFGVVTIVLAGFASIASVSLSVGEGGNQKELILEDLAENLNPKVDPLLEQQIKDTPSGEVAVIIELKEQQKEPFNVKSAETLALESQKSLTMSLEEIGAKNIKQHWIINAVSARVPVEEIGDIATRPDVKKVWLDKEIRLIEPLSIPLDLTNYSDHSLDYTVSEDDNMIVNTLSNNSEDSLSRTIEVINNTNYTSSWVDEVTTSGYSRRLYLRPDLIGDDHYLSEYPETSYWYIVTLDTNGANDTWGNYRLEGDISGASYSYWIYFASASSTTFKIEIIISGTTVATFPNLVVPYDPYYKPFSIEITGLDPITSSGDEVILKITKISGGTGGILFGTGAYSNIIIPGIEDYADDIINVPQMWDQGYDGNGVIISILDSGIDDTHPDLEGKVVAEHDFTDDGTTDDLYGHGTHCAGIAAGKHNATTKVTGVAPGAFLVSAKVLSGESGTGFTSWAIAATEWSVEQPFNWSKDQGAKILSMSFGGWQEDGTARDPLSMAVTNAINAGHIVVIAAGNEGPGENTIRSPAVVDGAIVVGASDSADKIVNFSSRGPTGDGRCGVDVVAPGDQIIAPNALWESEVDYVVMDGTSMSCPHVAGAAALLLQANPSLTPREVEGALKNGADDRGYDVWEQGAGRLDVKDAYDALTKGILIDSQWFVGRVRSGSYTKKFTVINNNVSEKTISITHSTGDAGNWITLSTSSLPVPAEGSATFDATMIVPKDAIGAYKGSIRVNDGMEDVDIIIPVSVNVICDTIKTEHVTGTIDEDYYYDTIKSEFPFGGDWVYYTLSVPSTTNLNLSLDWTNTQNDLDLILFNPNGTLKNVSGDNKPELITVENPSAGYWTVAINAWELKTAQETYTLDIELGHGSKGDFDGDGDVDFDDFVEFAGAYGTSEGYPTYDASADFDDDGDVDFDDFVEFAGVYTG
jgi:serine protease AprX